MKFKIIAYIGTWLAALFATDPTLGLWSLAWMFPLGLFAFFFPEHRQEGGWAAIIGIVAVYVAHAFFYISELARHDPASSWRECSWRFSSAMSPVVAT